jgi:hypothetical protein
MGGCGGGADREVGREVVAGGREGWATHNNGEIIELDGLHEGGRETKRGGERVRVKECVLRGTNF